MKPCNIALLFVTTALLACSQSPYRAEVEYEGYNPITKKSAESTQLGDLGDAVDETLTPIIEKQPSTTTTTAQYQYERYIVQKGDTAYSIARTHAMSLAELRKKNNLDASYTIHLGDTLLVRATNGGGITSPAPTRPVAKTKGSGTWLAPLVRPTVAADYLQASDKKDRSGMLLVAQSGSKVMAIADGVVVFAGDELRHYGNMILVDHGNKIISAYAYLGNITVKEDTKVQGGQTIGHLAKSGKQPMLLQVRRGGKPVDPKNYVAFE